MMGIDSSIAMGVRTPQLESPMNALAKVLQVREAQQGQQMNALKMDEYQRGIQSQNSLRQLLGGFGSDHSANQQKLLQGGYMKEAQDYGKNQADIAKTTGEAQYKQIETAHKKIDLMGQVFGFVKDNPSAESALQATDYLVQNGIMTPEQAQATKAKISADPSPETIRTLATQAFQSALSTKDQLPKLQTFNAGDRQVNQSVNPITGKATETGSTAILQSADSQASERSAAAGRAVTMRGQDMTDARTREANQQGKIPPGYRATATGLEAIPGGPADIKAGAEGHKRTTDANDVLSLLDEVDKLLPKSTGSRIGAAADWTAGAFGHATEGAKTVAQLKMIQGALVSKMPKMSGPQSDKDVLLYREMAGQVGDPSLPVETRQAAASMLRKLNEKYAGMPAGGSLGTTAQRGGATGSWGDSNAPAAPISIKNAADYANVPSGATYIDPNGKMRKKP